MGDRRFEAPYDRLADADNAVETLRGFRHEEVIEALAAASRKDDPLLANVLATEALNRIARARVIGGAFALGVASALSLTFVVVLAFAVAEPNFEDQVIFLAVALALLLGAVLTYTRIRYHPTMRHRFALLRDLERRQADP
ncbi:MAG TPA: hypothetical protein VNZ52_07825 [Candidatus Thermoplasmatota archaeon]|nr:hypothetical protein [Candidatus Thermoplasmatota archaeon]